MFLKVFGKFLVLFISSKSSVAQKEAGKQHCCPPFAVNMKSDLTRNSEPNVEVAPRRADPSAIGYSVTGDRITGVQSEITKSFHA